MRLSAKGWWNGYMVGVPSSGGLLQLQGRDEMASYDLPRTTWRTSSYSGQNSACVEVAVVPAWQTST
jgi:hypothetical protein